MTTTERERINGFNFSRSGARTPSWNGDGAPPLLESEKVTLAKLRYFGVIQDTYNDPDTQRLRDLLVSLERFRYADYGHIYNDANLWTGWGWAVSEHGLAVLESAKPYRYGCRCEHAIRLFCVCNEKTYCPNPEHTGNGCHGSHD